MLPNVYYTHCRASSVFPAVLFMACLSALCGVTYWQSRLIADIPKAAAPRVSGNSGEREFLTAHRTECLSLLKTTEKNIWQFEDAIDGFERGVETHEKAWKAKHDPRERERAEESRNQIHNLQIGLMASIHTKERLHSIINAIEERLGEIR